MTATMTDSILDNICRELMGEASTAKNALPPVNDWNPALCGDIDIRIARDGTWYHDGEVIHRAALVKLFSTILKREGNEYFLVTPAEKWRIRVDDVPFAVTGMTRMVREGHQILAFASLTDDHVVAGPDHPLRVVINPFSGEPSPYLHIRDNLDGLITRAVFYEIAALAEERLQGAKCVYGVTSLGVFFPLM